MGNKNVDAVRAAVAALNGGDIDGYLRHFDPACPRWVAGLDGPLSLADIRASLDQFHAAFKGLVLDEELVFGDDRYVCARWRLRGTQVGDYFGIASTGRSIDVQTCEIYELDAARVVTVWTHGDPGALFRQIGADAGEGAS